MRQEKRKRRKKCFRARASKIMFSFVFFNWETSKIHFKYWRCWGLVLDSNVFGFYVKKGWVKEFPSLGKPVINVMICTIYQSFHALGF